MYRLVRRTGVRHVFSLLSTPPLRRRHLPRRLRHARCGTLALVSFTLIWIWWRRSAHDRTDAGRPMGRHAPAHAMGSATSVSHCGFVVHATMVVLAGASLGRIL